MPLPFVGSLAVALGVVWLLAYTEAPALVIVMVVLGLLAGAAVLLFLSIDTARHDDE